VAAARQATTGGPKDAPERALHLLCEGAYRHSDAAPVAAPRDWLDAHALTLGRAADKGGVCYDTPWLQADALAGALVAEHGAGAWWGDPCCGVGRLLIAVLDAVAERGVSAVVIALRSVRFGDIERAAGELTRDALQHWSVSYALAQGGSTDEAKQIAQAALDLPPPLGSVFDWPEMRDGLVITNPPFESIRSAHRRLGRVEVEALRARFDVCAGAFDLGVPVVARCMELAAGGALALVAPTRWLSAGYGDRLRIALDDAGAWHRIASKDRPFEAQVDVLLALLVREGAASQAPPEFSRLRWQQCDEPPAGCVPLCELATVMSGTPGFDAKRVSIALRDRDELPGVVDCEMGTEAWPFYSAASVSAPGDGACDNKQPRSEGLAELAHVAVRLCGRPVMRPMLPRHAVTSTKRAAFYDAPKFIVPGVARTLLAAWSDAPAALSVGVVGIIPLTEEAKASIAAALVSEESQQWLRDVAPGRGLSNGFERFPARLLAKLPVRVSRG
jgi:hypothetical protein